MQKLNRLSVLAALVFIGLAQGCCHCCPLLQCLNPCQQSCCSPCGPSYYPGPSAMMYPPTQAPCCSPQQMPMQAPGFGPVP